MRKETTVQLWVNAPVDMDVRIFKIIKYVMVYDNDDKSIDDLCHAYYLHNGEWVEFKGFEVLDISDMTFTRAEVQEMADGRTFHKTIHKSTEPYQPEE